MKRSRLKNIANKSQNPIDKSNYKKQRNLVVRLNRRCKAQYFKEVMNTSKDTRPFWTACKPYFSNKHSKGDSKIILIENNEIIQDNEKVANIFNSYFESITDSLELFKWTNSKSNYHRDKIDSITQKFCLHLSIIRISQNCTPSFEFSFQQVTCQCVTKIIKELPGNKKSGGEIPASLLKKCN